MPCRRSGTPSPPTSGSTPSCRPEFPGSSREPPEMTGTTNVALVTGASRGIGAATATVLAQRGFRVVVNYRSSAEEADAVVAAITAAGGEAVAARADVTEPDAVAAMVADTEERWGRIDVVVHNALIPFTVTSFND